MSMYRIPKELIELVKVMCNNFECAVLDEGETTEWFHVQSGVKQGCIMSGFLFLLAIDWVLSGLQKVEELVHDGSSPRSYKT